MLVMVFSINKKSPMRGSWLLVNKDDVFVNRCQQVPRLSEERWRWRRSTGCGCGLLMIQFILNAKPERYHPVSPGFFRIRVSHKATTSPIASRNSPDSERHLLFSLPSCQGSPRLERVDNVHYTKFLWFSESRYLVPRPTRKYEKRVIFAMKCQKMEELGLIQTHFSIQPHLWVDKLRKLCKL